MRAGAHVGLRLFTLLIAVTSMSCGGAQHSRMSPSNTVAGPAATRPSVASSVGSATLAPTADTSTDVTPARAAASMLPYGVFLDIQHSIGRSLNAATNRLVSSCMRASGFDLSFPPAPSRSVSFLERRYGLADRATLEINGYSSPGRTTRSTTTGSTDLNSPEAQHALYGTGEPTTTGIIADDEGAQIGTVTQPGGCVGAAQRDVFGSFERYVEFNQALSTLEGMAEDSYYQTIGSDQMARVDAEWFACMQAVGLSRYRTSIDAQNTDWRATSEEPSDEERRYAVADFDCRQSVRYEERAFDIEAGFQREHIDEFANALRNLQEFFPSLGL